MREGWEYGKLDELITFNQIGIIRSKKEQGIDKAFKYLKMDNIHNTNGFKDEGYVFVDANEEEVAKYSLENEDFLFNTRNSYDLVGKTCLFINNSEETILFNNNVMRMRFKEILIPKFVEFAFCSEEILEQLEKMKSGTTSVVGIYYKSLRNLKIPIPPLPEQKQIVAILDKAFTAIDQAQANIEKNIENAKELFQSKLNEIFSKKGEGWEEKSLISFSKFIDYRGKTPKKTESGIPLITAKNVRMGYLKEEPREYIAEDAYDEWMTRGIPSKGDVLFTTEAPLANVTLLNTDKKIALAQRIITICPDREVALGEYLTFCLQSKIVQDRILSKGTGATVTGIKSKLLKEVLIPITSKQSQLQIIEELNETLTFSNRLVETYELKLDNLEELKKSTLQKAFAGELTQTEVTV